MAAESIVRSIIVITLTCHPSALFSYQLHPEILLLQLKTNKYIYSVTHPPDRAINTGTKGTSFKGDPEEVLPLFFCKIPKKSLSWMKFV